MIMATLYLILFAFVAFVVFKIIESFTRTKWRQDDAT